MTKHYVYGDGSTNHIGYILERFFEEDESRRRWLEQALAAEDAHVPRCNRCGRKKRLHLNNKYICHSCRMAREKARKTKNRSVR